MAVKTKKMAAALAAVTLYLQEEEAAVQEEAALKTANPSEFSAWGHSGRQDMMSMRRLIQMRVFTHF